MIRFLLSSVSFGILAVSSAAAADLPQRAAPPAFIAPAPVSSWTGFYVGAHAGYAWQSNSITVQEVGFPRTSISPDGFVGGALVGFNYQIDKAIIGLEGDLGFASISGSGNAGGPGGFAHANSLKQDFDGRLRARLGFDGGNFMPFIAGGYTNAHEKLTVSSAAVSSTVSKSLDGWNIGVGLDYAFAGGWIGRLEYIYDQFGSATYVPGAGFNPRAAGQLSQSTVRAALIYKFGAPAAPVVAKY